MTSEKVIEEKVCAFAKEKGVLVFKLMPMGQRGWPDRLFLFHGQSMFVEFKAENGHLSQIQRERLHQLHKLQHTALVIYDIASGVAAVEAML